MTSEELPHNQGEAETYTPTFNLDQMSVENIVSLAAALSDAEGDFVGGEYVEGPRDALELDLVHYPSTNYDRALEVLEALSRGDNDHAVYLGASAVRGLLSVADQHHEDKMYHALAIYTAFARHSYGTARTAAIYDAEEDIEDQTISPSMAGFMVRYVSELLYESSH